MLKQKEIKWMVGITGISIFFIFLTMLYVDNLTNSNAGYIVVDRIFKGEFRQLYNESDWSYGLSIYMIYALWSIPIWFINHISGLEINRNAIPVLLYYKLLLVLFAVWSIYLIGKIAEQLYVDKKQEVQLQYVSSFLFIFPIFGVAQCDIIGLSFVLLGLYFYIKEQDILFILSFSVAITMKYFAVLVFVPLVLFRFRRIIKLITVLVAGMVLTIGSIVIIHGSNAGATAMNNPDFYVTNHIRRLAEVRIDMGASRIVGLLEFFYILLCILAYILPNQDKRKNKEYAVWLIFGGYLCFFLFHNCNFYWYVLLAPFMILLAYIKPGLTKICLLLETIYGITVALDCMNKQFWVFLGPDTFNYLFIKKDIINNWLFTRIYWFLESYMPAILGISYASIIAILVLAFPGIKDISIEDENEKEMRIVTWMRIGVIYVWIILALVGTIDF